MELDFVPVADNAKREAAFNGRRTLDVRQISRWTNGLVFNITGKDVVYDKNAGNEDNAFVVLTTSVNGNKFDNLFLSTLVRPVTDYNGQDIQPDGELNKLARQLLDDQTVTSDGILADRILAAIAGRQVKVKRDRKITRMSRRGDLFISMLLEFTF